jgi:hypothetical protein
VILKSLDLKRWHQVTTITIEGNHWNPKFCKAGNQLFLSFTTTYPNQNPRDISGKLLHPNQKIAPTITHITSSDDGVKWTPPHPALQNQILYKIRRHDGVFYAAGWKWKQDIRDNRHGPLNLLSSDDAQTWSPISLITGIKDNPNETDLWFKPDGEVWAITRTNRKPWHSLFFSSRPPYKEWNRTDLKTTIHCPCFAECNGQLFVAGRRWWEELWIPQKLYPQGTTAIWTVKKGKIIPFWALPTDGDSGYPGLISTETGTLLMSFYSQHAYTSGDIPWKIKPRSLELTDLWLTDDDIFIAEIDLKKSVSETAK